MRYSATLLAFMLCAVADAADDPLAKSRQCLVVITDSWTSTEGKMSIFEREPNAHSPWQRRKSGIAVRVGRNGLAWGRGLIKTASWPGPMKREGDDKAPAGIFRLQSVFGYKRETKMSFVALSENVVAVDDPQSRYYNQLVDRSKIDNPDWRSAEKLSGVDVYKLGVVVEQNSPPKPGAGSCIFLHVWKTPGTPTSGCTAMSENDLVDVIRWLDPAQQPLLVEMPQSSYEVLRTKWNLPALLR
ncbi:MAG: L,D-transpeptidase family protein [Verrucomicrobiota bacterium]|nr:L,D-transpeptidase family protein [Verrucomicrobiota bacterium]